MEPIQIWNGRNAPERYRRFFPWATEADWIAVVDPTATHEFTQHLMTGGDRLAPNIFSHVLSDGTWMFYGQITESLAKKK
jgi:hypothetical protein